MNEIIISPSAIHRMTLLATLRRICEKHGDMEWTDATSVRDLLERNLEPYLEIESVMAEQGLEQEYVNALCAIVGVTVDNLFPLLSATPAQRSQAALKALEQKR